jgi:hypothetical protein
MSASRMNSANSRPGSVADWTIEFERIFPPNRDRKPRQEALPSPALRTESSARAEAPVEARQPSQLPAPERGRSRPPRP